MGFSKCGIKELDRTGPKHMSHFIIGVTGGCSLPRVRRYRGEGSEIKKVNSGAHQESLNQGRLGPSTYVTLLGPHKRGKLCMCTTLNSRLITKNVHSTRQTPSRHVQSMYKPK